MRFYVVSDPHGFYSCLIEALEEAGFFEDSEPHKLVVCGDVLDRGEEAVEIVDFLLDLAEKDMLILIKGNHEDLFVRCLMDIAQGYAYDIACGDSYHYRNRTWHSMLQLARMKEKTAVDFSSSLVTKVRNSRFYRELLPLCRDYYETEHYIFCHGWIPVINKGDKYTPIYEYDPDWRRADVTRWSAARWYNGMELACDKKITEPKKTIVCGHWHTSFGHHKYEGKGTYRGENDDLTPFYADGIIALDGCTVYSKRVNCIVLEDNGGDTDENTVS